MTTDLPRASARESAATIAKVLLPLVGRGLILRRPWVVAMAARMDADQRAVRQMQHLHRRYGPGPVALRIPGRDVVLVLTPDDAREVLDSSPEPFALATREKRAALAHFQPEGVLASTGPQRAIRRQVNETALELDAPVHHLAPAFVRVIAEEVASLLSWHPRTLGWDAFIVAWMRVVRRVVFGDAARDDHELTDLAGHLRAAANWSYLRPERTDVRTRFHDRIAQHIARAEEGSLASVLAHMPDNETTEPTQQVPQWLFAFDPAGIATIRTLALLASHPQQAAQAEEEVTGLDLSQPQQLPYLRSCVMESVRLWPTTPAVLRETTNDTTLGGHRIAAGSTVLVHAPFLHRDPQASPSANRFDPGLWSAGEVAVDWPLIPFSGGPGRCPGQNVVLLTTTTFLAHILSQRTVTLTGRTPLSPDKPLPGTLNPYGLRFHLRS